MIYLFSLWLALGAAVVAMALYRKYVSRNEDDALHLTPGMDVAVQRQAQLAGQLDWIDRWGKTLTVVAVLYGMALAGYWLYQAWLESGQIR
jgi:hypothetical protein